MVNKLRKIPAPRNVIILDYKLYRDLRSLEKRFKKRVKRLLNYNKSGYTNVLDILNKKGVITDPQKLKKIFEKISSNISKISYSDQINPNSIFSYTIRKYIEEMSTLNRIINDPSIANVKVDVSKFKNKDIKNVLDEKIKKEINEINNRLLSLNNNKSILEKEIKYLDLISLIYNDYKNEKNTAGKSFDLIKTLSDSIKNRAVNVINKDDLIEIYNYYNNFFSKKYKDLLNNINKIKTYSKNENEINDILNKFKKFEVFFKNIKNNDNIEVYINHIEIKYLFNKLDDYINDIKEKKVNKEKNEVKKDLNLIKNDNLCYILDEKISNIIENDENPHFDIDNEIDILNKEKDKKEDNYKNLQQNIIELEKQKNNLSTDYNVNLVDLLNVEKNFLISKYKNVTSSNLLLEEIKRNTIFYKIIKNSKKILRETLSEITGWTPGILETIKSKEYDKYKKQVEKDLAINENDASAVFNAFVSKIYVNGRLIKPTDSQKDLAERTILWGMLEKKLNSISLNQQFELMKIIEEIDRNDRNVPATNPLLKNKINFASIRGASAIFTCINIKPDGTFVRWDTINDIIDPSIDDNVKNVSNKLKNTNVDVISFLNDLKNINLNVANTQRKLSDPYFKALKYDRISVSDDKMNFDFLDYVANIEEAFKKQINDVNSDIWKILRKHKISYTQFYEVFKDKLPLGSSLIDHFEHKSSVERLTVKYNSLKDKFIFSINKSNVDDVIKNIESHLTYIKSKFDTKDPEILNYVDITDYYKTHFEDIVEGDLLDLIKSIAKEHGDRLFSGWDDEDADETKISSWHPETQKVYNQKKTLVENLKKLGINVN